MGNQRHFMNNQRRTMRLCALWALLMILAGCGGSSGNSAATTAPSTPQSIDVILNDVASGPIDGVFVAVERNGVVQSYAAGVQNKPAGEAAAADSLFKIASISKLFIAVAATKLVAENNLQMEDTLAMWLPEMADQIANAEQITIRQMLAHRSGIPDFDSQPGFNWQQAHTSLQDTLAYALNLPADFAPNARFEYSNTNYLLIGMVLDQVLGFSHHRFIQDRILNPLEMQDTYLLLGDADPARLAHGYWGGRDRIAQDYVIPGGSMVSTTKDTAVFIRAMNTGDLLTAEERRLYPYFFNHSGWVPGYQSFAEYQADSDAVIVLFANTTGDGSESSASEAMERIRQSLRN